MPSSLSIESVTLRVRDLAKVEAFYLRVLGLVATRAGDKRSVLSASPDSAPLIVLEEHTWAAPRSPGSAGLFHTAFLYPGRAQLGAMLGNLDKEGVPFGAGDHGVSEALYLYDPEDNGIELYADRPRSAWPVDADGKLRMGTEMVDLASLDHAGRKTSFEDASVQARIGHIHLSVTDLTRAKHLYSEKLGFPVRQGNFPGALFLGRDGYHHHFGLNVWHSRRPASAKETGLERFTLVLESADACPAFRSHAVSGAQTLRDPDGWEIAIRSGHSGGAN